MRHWPLSGTCFWRRFLALETGASCLMPETLTHFASKWYRQKKKQPTCQLRNLRFCSRFYHDRSLMTHCTEIHFFHTVLLVEKCFHHYTLSFIFVYKQTSSAIVYSDWPITVQLSSRCPARNWTCSIQCRFLLPEKYDRLTSFCYQWTGTRNRRQKLASVSSL